MGELFLDWFGSEFCEIGIVSVFCISNQKCGLPRTSSFVSLAHIQARAVELMCYSDALLSRASAI
jgi:hypothetical protein